MGRLPYRGPNVILIRFGGGVRRLETIQDSEHTYCPFVYHELFKKKGILFPNVEIDSAPGVVTSHGQGTLYLLTGRYDTYEDITRRAFADRFVPKVPTLFEYLRGKYAIPAHQALIVNGEDRVNEEFYTFSNNHLYGIRYRSTVLSLYRFKTFLLREELKEGRLSDKERETKQKKLEKMENLDYRVENRDRVIDPEIDKFWRKWRSYYGSSGLVNPRGDRLLTTLALWALRELLLKDTNSNTRRGAAYVLSRAGAGAKKAQAALDHAANDSDPFVRRWALHALWNIRKDPRTLRTLAALLADKSMDVRIATAHVLGDFGAAAKEVAPSVRAALKDPEWQVRHVAAESLWLIARDAEALKALIALANEPDSQARSQGAASLGFALRSETNPPAGPLPEAVTTLIAALKDKDDQVRMRAAEALGRIGPAAKAAVAVLAQRLQAEDEDAVHSAAAEALGRIGPDAKPALGVLTRHLKNPDIYVRINAAKALWHIAQSAEAAGVAEAFLDFRRPMVRIYAAETLWAIRRDPAMLPRLRDAVRVETGTPLYASLRALGRIGAPAREAIPVISELLHHEEPAIRQAAREALLAIDPKQAEKILP